MQENTPKITVLVQNLRNQLEKEVRDVLPRRVGVQAVNLVKRNFRDGGFHDGGLKPWQKSQRELAGGKSAGSRYGTLLSARNHLMSSTQYRAVPAGVLIENPVPYASLHNEGGVVSSSPAVTPRMRKFAWAMVYKTAGVKKGKGKNKQKGKLGNLSPEAQKWLALALTKKTHLHIRAKMPKRQFIGESRELSEMVRREILESLKRIKTTSF